MEFFNRICHKRTSDASTKLQVCYATLCYHSWQIGGAISAYAERTASAGALSLGLIFVSWVKTLREEKPMPACLEAEYDSVLPTLMDYATYTVDMRSRLYLSEHWIRHLIPILPTVLFVSIGSPVLYDLIRRSANEKERSSPFYDVVLSDYPLETLALQFEAGSSWHSICTNCQII